MSIIMRALTSTSDAEISDCLQILVNSTADTWFIHESFHKNDASITLKGWCGTLKRVVWYFEWWCGTLKGGVVL